MPVFTGEASDLVLDRRTVARTNSLYHTGKERRPIETGGDNLVCARVRTGHPTWHLAGMLSRSAEEGKNRDRLISTLLGKQREVYRAAIDSRRSYCFKPAHRWI